MSIMAEYYRLSPAEREKVTHDQASWKTFEDRVVIGRLKKQQEAIAKLNVDGLTREQRMAKINEALEKCRDPQQFSMEKDWQTINYLLTGEAKIKEEHISGQPLHNAIFGGLKTSVQTGYGPVRYFDSKLVAESAAALVGADRKTIASRFDPAAMKKLEIYAYPDAREKEGVLKFIEEFTAFFQKAAAAHEEVIKFTW